MNLELKRVQASCQVAALTVEDDSSIQSQNRETEHFRKLLFVRACDPFLETITSLQCSLFSADLHNAGHSDVDL
jgi:hypothetical protein